MTAEADIDVPTGATPSPGPQTDRSGTESDGTAAPAGRNTRHRRRWVAGGAAAAIAAAAVVWVAGRGDGTDPATTTAAAAAHTAEVVRQTIADVRTFGGTLGHGEGHTVSAGGDGVVTGVASQGSEIAVGDELYALDGDPVVVMFGSAPMYRDLRVGDSGQDVAQLIENLHALGYGTDCDAIDELTVCVQAAVAAWRADAGLTTATVATPVAAAGDGVVTWVAAPGTIVGRGDELYRIDEHPVVALVGEIPMYRDLGQGDSGQDVAQLIDNLRALGYAADCDAADEFTWCVRDAVREWQEDRGVDETGRVDRGDVVFVAEAVRVDTVLADVGEVVGAGTPLLDVAGGDHTDPVGVVIGRAEIAFVPGDSQVDTVHAGVGDVVAAGAAVLDLTGTDQVASVEVEVRFRELLAVGTDVTVELAGGLTVPGTVTAANVVAAGDGGGPDDTVTQVEVTLLSKVDASLLGSPVDVLVEVNHRTDVLTVPVTALLALAGGGHGVEVVEPDGSVSLVPVDTGLFAGGWVEVSGDGIGEDTTVVAAGR